MKVLSCEEIRAVEQETVEQQGIPTFALMQRAAHHIANKALALLKGKRNPRVVIAAGKGNNGGDGILAADLLHKKGLDVKTFLAANREELRGDAEIASSEAAIELLPLIHTDHLARFQREIKQADLIIDALYGTGLRGAVTGIGALAIEIINQSNALVLSIDIPSGLEGDTGWAEGPAVRADHTVSLGALKVGQVIFPGAGLSGEMEMADIGLQEESIATAKVDFIEEQTISYLLPKRSNDTHKKAVGNVAVIAGSFGMGGAAALASQAAMRSGAGICYLMCAKSLMPILQSKLTEVIIKPMPESTTGFIALQAYGAILEMLDEFDVAALGPGLSLRPETVAFIRQAADIRKPLLLDADGLTAFAGEIKMFAKRTHPTILTPHTGEMARLLGCETDDIKRDRLGVARRAAEESSSVVVLKGTHSIVASPSGQAAVIPTGNPGLATAGTGDVLTGIIVGLWAQGMDSFDAAVCGTYIHGLAGDLAKADLTEYAMIASDVIDYLPKAFKKVLAKS